MMTMQLGLIESAMEEFKRRIKESSSAPSCTRTMVDAALLVKVLASYGIVAAKEDLMALLASNEDKGIIERDEMEMSEDGDNAVPFDELLTCIGLWKMVVVSEE